MTTPWRPPRRVETDAQAALLVLAGLVAGLFLVQLTTPVGSGDYGQWLMTSRRFLGEEVPGYRPLNAVPPLVPMLLGAFQRLMPDRFVAVQAFSGLMLAALAVSLYLAGAALQRSRPAGLLALVLGLLVAAPLLDLFAFGGLLQAGALTCGTLGVAAGARAAATGRTLWWGITGLCLVLAVLAHLATGLMALVSGTAVALVSMASASGTLRERLRRLTPLGSAWVIALVFWLTTFLPGSGIYAANPASLNYRGPDRLFDDLFGHPLTALVVIGGGAAITVGVILEVSRRSFGRWSMTAAWIAGVGVFLVGSLVGGAATDYPRFVTPVLVPLAVAAAAGLALVVAWIASFVRLPVLPAPLAWSLVAITAVAVVAAPFAANQYREEAAGYRLIDPGSLVAVAEYVEGTVPLGATVLAPVREGKWLEGLTGRASLFNNPVRYSFRADEWQRALAASTLLQSRGAVVNEFFFVKFTDADPCASGTPPTAFTLAMNHGGEYLDALRVATEGTRVLGPAGETLATVSTLQPGSITLEANEGSIRVRSEWHGERERVAISFRQAVLVTSNGATMEITSRVETAAPIGGLQLDLRAAAGLAITRIDVRGSEAELSLTMAGRTEPRLRLVVAGDTGTLSALPDGGVRVASSSNEVRLLVTDLTASTRSSSSLRLLCPLTLRETYGIAAVVLTRDASYDARRARVEALGFRLARTIGPYAVMLRDTAVARQALRGDQ